MGEIAEDMLDGSCCSLCGQYFQHPNKDKYGQSIGIYVYEYPVICWECWNDLKPKEKQMYQKAEVSTY